MYQSTRLCRVPSSDHMAGGMCALGWMTFSFEMKSDHSVLSFINVTTDPRCSRSLGYPMLSVSPWNSFVVGFPLAL